VEASKEYNTLQTILDLDVANGTVRTSGSHSRNLRRVRQGLDLIRALFEQFLSTTYVHPLSIFLFPFCFSHPQHVFLVKWISYFAFMLYAMD
jgi:ABC-type transport system involved in Fe-S cluster assembly fused permease/ATPase subunit